MPFGVFRDALRHIARKAVAHGIEDRIAHGIARSVAVRDGLTSSPCEQDYNGEVNEPNIDLHLWTKGGPTSGLQLPGQSSAGAHNPTQ